MGARLSERVAILSGLHIALPTLTHPQIFQLGALVRRIDADLADHLQREGVDYVQFAFRWVNCLLQREVPLALSLRLWDTYLVRAGGEVWTQFKQSVERHGT